MPKTPAKDDARKRMPKVPPKHFTPMTKGKASRAQNHKGNKVQPAHQGSRLQKGR